MNGADVGDNFGNSVAGAGDVNADGTPDFVVGAFHTSPNGRYRGGSAYIYSGATGSLLKSFHGAAAQDNFGYSVSGAGDLNGDGFADIIIGAHGADPGGRSGAGSAYIYSGESGMLLFQMAGAAFADPNGQAEAGSAFLFGFNPFLQSSVSSFSASAGSLVGLQLDFPTAAASAEYKVLISASGTGIISYGVEIPLTLDSLVLQTFSGNYPFAVSTGMQGNLNILGDAAASISISPGAYSRFVGRTVHLAAIANQPGYLPSHSSIAVAP